MDRLFTARSPVALVDWDSVVRTVVRGVVRAQRFQREVDWVELGLWFCSSPARSGPGPGLWGFGVFLFGTHRIITDLYLMDMASGDSGKVWWLERDLVSKTQATADLQESSRNKGGHNPLICVDQN